MSLYATVDGEPSEQDDGHIDPRKALGLFVGQVRAANDMARDRVIPEDSPLLTAQPRRCVRGLFCRTDPHCLSQSISAACPQSNPDRSCSRSSPAIVQLAFAALAKEFLVPRRGSFQGRVRLGLEVSDKSKETFPIPVGE